MPADVQKKIDAYFSRYPSRTYPKGQILVFGGEDPDHVYYLVKGDVRSYDISYKGDEIVVNVFKPGAFFPMSWAINKKPNKYFFKTETEVMLHVAPPEDAVDFIKANPDVMLDLLSRLYSGVDGILGRLVQLMAGTAKQRLMYELVIECDRSGTGGKDGRYDLGINEIDLAARSGLTRETVNREMHKIKTENLVDITKKGIVVKDLGALKQKLGLEL